MAYEGLTVVSEARAPHLGGSIQEGDPFSFCAAAWDYVITRFGIESILDLGSGCGNAAHYFYRRGLKVVAIEGLTHSVESSLYPAVRHDLTQGPVFTRVDLVHCQEVAEHIDERHVEHLFDTFLCGRIILMTHATPGQPGHHHVNTQPEEYWVNKMRQKGCVLLEEDTRRVRGLAGQEGAAYLHRTGLVFSNKNRR